MSEETKRVRSQSSSKDLEREEGCGRIQNTVSIESIQQFDVLRNKQKMWVSYFEIDNKTRLLWISVQRFLKTPVYNIRRTDIVYRKFDLMSK